MGNKNGVPGTASRSDETRQTTSDILFDDQSLTDKAGVVYIVANDYRYDDEMALRYCGVDLQKMRKFFDNRLDKYYIVTSQNRTRENFINTLKYLAAWSKYPPSCKRIIIYFSGHGSAGHITMEKDAKKANSSEGVEINEMLSIFRTEIGKKMVKIILLDACCNTQSVNCEEGSNELVACAASKGYTSQSDEGGGYWTHQLLLGLTEKEDCDLVTVLQYVKREMEYRKTYPVYNKNGELEFTTFSPSFKNGLLETEKIFFRRKEMALLSTIKKETFHPLIRKHSKLIEKLIELFENTSFEELVRFFNGIDEESLNSDQIQGTTAGDFFNHLLAQQKFKYYAPDLLLDFVIASCNQQAIAMVIHYIKFSYNNLLTDLNLICEQERVKRENIQPLENKKILQIKSEVMPLSSQKEFFIRDIVCKCLNMPSSSVSFLGPIPGCIILVYRYKMSDNSKQQLLQNTILVKDLAPLADLNVRWLRIDNNMELKIPSVEESIQDAVVSWTKIEETDTGDNAVADETGITETGKILPSPGDNAEADKTGINETAKILPSSDDFSYFEPMQVTEQDNNIEPLIITSQDETTFCGELTRPKESTVKQLEQTNATDPPSSIKSTIPQVFLIPVGHSEEMKCDGKCGGSYLWKGHDFAIILPPDCADEIVTFTLEAYLPSSTQEHSLVSAVFNITTNVKQFKQPIAIRFPHSKSDKKLRFLICHNDTYQLKNGYFNYEKSVGSVKLSEFCFICICEDFVMAGFAFIKTCFQCITSHITASTSSQEINTVTPLSNLEKGITECTTETSDKKYLDFLVLPEDHNEKWRIYCIALDNPTYLQALVNFLNEKWINPSIQVKILKRRVAFVVPTNDAIAEVCIVDKPADGKIIKLLQDKQIEKQKVDSLHLRLSENVGNNNTLIVNNKEHEIYFPVCFLHFSGKLSSSSSKLKVDGLCGIGQESSEFSLASPTEHGYKFEIYTHIEPQMIIQRFDCVAAADELRKQLSTLPELNYSAMMGSLFSKYVITNDERKIIDVKIGQQKMMYLIADIIIPSLKLNLCDKYKGFLEAMEESDDTTLRNIAKRLGGSKSVPES